ncbi:TPA: hypothetical protein N0F65_002520, partial [Lagenidium giganteum]
VNEPTRKNVRAHTYQAGSTKQNRYGPELNTRIGVHVVADGTGGRSQQWPVEQRLQGVRAVAKEFFRRHKLSFRCRRHQGQISPPDAEEATQAFTNEIRELIATRSITAVLNAGQTRYIEMLPSGPSAVLMKRRDKERVTAPVMADSNGYQFPLFVVFKVAASTVPSRARENKQQQHRFSKRLWHGTKRVQEGQGIQIYNPTGYHYIVSILVSGQHSVSQLLDAFSGDWIDEVVEYAATLNVVLKKIPPRLTWVSQPAEVCWIKPVKDALRREWELTCDVNSVIISKSINALPWCRIPAVTYASGSSARGLP